MFACADALYVGVLNDIATLTEAEADRIEREPEEGAYDVALQEFRSIG